jgi:hypothetical protein
MEERLFVHPSGQRIVDVGGKQSVREGAGRFLDMGEGDCNRTVFGAGLRVAEAGSEARQ